MVRIPANFDPTKPIHLVIYNHGFGSTAQSAFSDSHLAEQMASAPANTVLIVPEWQKDPGGRNSQQGKFATSGDFRGMLQEALEKTPELQGKTLNDIQSIGIIAHSAGYAPAETELYKNGLGNKVNSITLLDALY